MAPNVKQTCINFELQCIVSHEELLKLHYVVKFSRGFNFAEQQCSVIQTHQQGKS